MQLPQICGLVLPASHTLVTLFISSVTTGIQFLLANHVYARATYW